MLRNFIVLLVSAIYIATAVCNYVPPTTYTYKTVGNLTIEADVYVPNVTVQGKHPVVLAIHGGGYVGGTKQGGCSLEELVEMLSRGWCVVSIDYRLAPNIFLYDMVQDVQDAYAWIRNELVNMVPLDLDSFIVLGGSAGGGLAAISGYMLSPRPQAVISFYPGCTNYTDAFDYNGSSPVPPTFVSMMDSLMQPLTEYNMTGGPNDTRSLLFNTAVSLEKVGWMLATHDPNESVAVVLEYLREYSVVYHIDSSYPPTSLIHGFDDTLVPHQQSVEMAGYLAKAGVPHQLILVPGVGHAFDFGNVSVAIWDNYILPAFNFAEKYINGNAKSNVTLSQ